MPDNNKQQSFSMIGIVDSDRMDKTRVIVVEKRLRHPKYSKPVKRKVRYKAHDEQNQSHRGDKVEIVLSRPMSRGKRWRISKIIHESPVNAGNKEVSA